MLKGLCERHRRHGSNSRLCARSVFRVFRQSFRFSLMSLFKSISPGFSVADAAYPLVVAQDDQLELAFKEWSGREVKVQFVDVCAYRWQEAESLLPGEPYDGAIELLNSEWLVLHVSRGVIAATQSVHHYRFNFNACGQFEVLCGSFSLSEASS